MLYGRLNDHRGTTIIGAGVAGLCVASALTRRDVPVRIVDQHGAPAGHSCSWWAGGMLAPFCEGETAEEPVVRLGQRLLTGGASGCSGYASRFFGADA